MSGAHARANPSGDEDDQERLAILAEHFDAVDVGDVPWEEPEEIECMRPELELISVRLPREDISELKRRAAQAGVSYTTLIRLIVRQHVRNPLVR